MKDVAGILLAGGRSQRMGRDKASLPWHGSTLARRAVGLLARCCEPPVIVVCAPEQELPADAELGRGRARSGARPRTARRPRRRPRGGGGARAGRRRLRRRRAARPPCGDGGARDCDRREPGGDSGQRRRAAAALRRLPHEPRGPCGRAARDGERRVSALGERAGARMVEPFELLVVDDVAAFDPGVRVIPQLRQRRCLRWRARRAAAARDRHRRARGAAGDPRLDGRPRAPACSRPR